MEVGLHGNVQQHSDGRAGDEHCRPPVADKGHRKPCGRQYPERYPGVDQRIQRDRAGDPHGQQPAEFVPRVSRDFHSAQEYQEKKEDEKQRADQSVFLPDDREDKVAVRFRQEMVALVTPARTEAEYPAVAEPDRRLRKLVLRLLHPFAVPDPDITHDALHPVFRADHVQDEQRDEGTERECDVGDAGSADKEHRQTYCKDHCPHAEIGLRQDKHRHRADPDEHRQKPLFEILHGLAFRGHEHAQVKHESEFRKIGRLQSEPADREPPGRPLESPPQNERDDKQGDRDNKCRLRELPVFVIVDLHEDEYRAEAEQDLCRVTAKHLSAFPEPVKRPRGAGAVHDPEAQDHQREDRKKTYKIDVVSFLAHGGLSVRASGTSQLP